MKPNPVLYVTLVAAVVLGLLGMERMLSWQRQLQLETTYRTLLESLQAADAVEDHGRALAMYEKMEPQLPEIQLRMLQRQWQVALDMLSHIRLHSFAGDELQLYERLKRHLERMQEACSVLLYRSGEMPRDIVWQVYTISSSAKLLAAFTTLETEQNWKKVRGTLRDAIADLKAAIDSVDSLNVSGAVKNIPRWNLELITAEQNVRKFKLGADHVERHMDLRDNLEALIPEKGGYAPGEPIERKIKK